MKIDSAIINDIGEYLVVAENLAGKDQTNCRVEVSVVPNIDETAYVNPEAFKFLEKIPSLKPEESDNEMKPPKVIIPLTDAKMIEGQPIHLACKIEGVPRPKVTYFVNNKYWFKN